MGSSTFAGWGTGWGSTFWGDDTSPNLELLTADAISENRLRLVFNRAPSFTGLNDTQDGTRPEHYTLTPVSGSTGRDGFAPRSVFPVYAEVVLDADPNGRIVDLYLDRSLSPYPGVYVLSVTSLVAADGASLDPAFSSVQFYGCQRTFLPPDPEQVVNSRDIANPQTLAMLLDSTGDKALADLGTFPVDQTGDYSTDEGLLNLKKRVFRRLMTAKGGFLHDTTYGVGIADQVKRLNTASVRESIALDAETQIAQEPDVRKVKVVAQQDPTEPSIVRFFIFVRTTAGQAVKFEASYNTAG